MGRTLRTALVIGGTSLVAVLGLAGAAQAHVTVNPDQAKPGAYTRIAFRVPDESDTAATTKLDVYLPTTQPLASVLVMPIPGWTAKLTSSKLATPIQTDDGDTVTTAISQITWTADSAGTAIKPGQFNEFPVSLGPLPKTGSMAFKALQTYSDGTVVRWIDTAVAGQAEPEHPAPVLTLTAAGGAATASTGPAAGGTGTSANASTESNGTATAAIIIGVVGALLGLIGLILGGLAYARTRRPMSPQPTEPAPAEPSNA